MTWADELPSEDLFERRLPGELRDLVFRTPHRCASISEYANAGNMDVAQVLGAFGSFLEEGVISLETAGNEIFVHTAPNGRPAPGDLAQIPPNLWEHLRKRLPASTAHAVWVLVRSMERAGWYVEPRPNFVKYGLGPVAKPTLFGIYVRNQVVPVLTYPSRESLLGDPNTGEQGSLAMFEQAGATSVACVCQQGALDATVTAAREWLLSKDYLAQMSIIVLEEPRYEPVMIRPDDGSVTPHAINYLSESRAQ